MVYALLVDQADPWVDRQKVRDRIDLVLAEGTGPAAAAAEAAMLMLAGGST